MSDDVLTLEAFKKVVPSHLRTNINQSVVDKFNAAVTDPLMREEIRDNIICYASVLRDGRFKIENYINAVKYVSYKLQGNSNIGAYIKTFPAKYEKFVNDGVAEKDIASYVSIYNKSKLVTLIFEQTFIPTHILNADLYQKALNTQAELMMTAKSEKVRCDAANSLLVQLKAPEVKKIELDVSMKEDKSIDELRAATLALAERQREMLNMGLVSTQEVAHSKIIEGEVLND